MVVVSSTIQRAPTTVLEWVAMGRGKKSERREREIGEEQGDLVFNVHILVLLTD